MRIYATLLCVVLLLGIASVGYCQWWEMGVMNAYTTARWAGMGATGIAAANDAAAIDFNPANLPNMQFNSMDRSPAWGGTATYGSGEDNDLSIKIGTVGNEGKWGAGFGFERVSDSGWHDNIYGLGYGAVCNPRWNWGVSITRDEWDSRSETWVNAGGLYTIPQAQGAPITAGLIVSNILEDDDDPRFYNLGVAIPVSEKILFAADWWDITDEWWKHYNFGAEAVINPQWCARLGRLDNDWTVGAGWQDGKVHVDAAYVDHEWGDGQWLVSGSIPF